MFKIYRKKSDYPVKVETVGYEEEDIKKQYKTNIFCRIQHFFLQLFFLLFYLCTDFIIFLHHLQVNWERMPQSVKSAFVQ